MPIEAKEGIMTLVLLLARLLLAVVFLIAGLAKLADQPGSQKALSDFGVPQILAKPLRIGLPLGEMALAVALVSARWAWYGAIGALVLLLVFIASITYQLVQGRRPACHCFGQLHVAPVGPPLFVRNSLLVLIASLVVWYGRGSTELSATRWLAARLVTQQMTLFAVVIVVVLMVGEGWFLLQMLSLQGRLLLRIERVEGQLAEARTTFGMSEQEPLSKGLPVGTEAPPFSGRGLDQDIISLATLRALGKPIILLFIDPDCGPCAMLMPEIGRWQREYTEKLTIALISRGSVEGNRAQASEHHLCHLVVQSQYEIDELYNVQGTPSAVLIHPEGYLEDSLAVGAELIHALVVRAISL